MGVNQIDFFINIWNKIQSDIILQYICICACVLLAIKILQGITKVFWFYWKQSYEERKKKREARKQEKLKWRYAKVTLDNPLLKQIISNRFIICKGGLGKGKSITMNLIAHFLNETREEEKRKNARYNKVMKPDYVKQELELKEQDLLPIYSNLDFAENGMKKQELLPYLCLQKRAVQKAVFCIDEVSSLFPKDMYYSTAGQENPLIEEMKELFKKNRHYTNGWILGTEQDGADIFIGFRKNGYALINCLGTTVSISPFGKFARKCLNFLNIILPGFITANYTRVFKSKLFLKDRIITAFKLFLPTYFLLPKEFYSRKQEINNAIKLRYQRFATRFQFESGEYYIRYTNKDIFRYDTRAYKDEYSSLFDKQGNRRRITSEQAE